MEKKHWKTLAIVSVILLILVVGGLGLIFMKGAEYEYNKQVCAYSICGLDKGEHDSYFYADVDDSCFCFNNGNLDFIEDIDYFLKHEK